MHVHMWHAVPNVQAYLPATWQNTLEQDQPGEGFTGKNQPYDYAPAGNNMTSQSLP